MLRHRRAGLLVLAALFWAGTASGLGLPTNSDRSFSFVLIGETQTRVDPSYSITGGCNPGLDPFDFVKPQVDSFGVGNLSDEDTDAGWVAASRVRPRAERIYPDNVLFAAIAGDLTDRALETNDAFNQAECGPTSGNCFQNDCDSFALFGYEFLDRAMAPVMQTGLCVFAVPGNHDLVCSRRNSKRQENGTGSNRCQDTGTPIFTTGNEVSYYRWLEAKPRTWMRRSCPKYQDDFNVSQQFGTSGQPGAGLGLNQRTIKRVYDTDILIIGMNIEPTDLEWSWVSGQLAANPNKPTVIITHAVVPKDGVPLATLIMDRYGLCNTCLSIDAIITQIRASHPQVFFIGGGHYHNTKAASYDTGSQFYDLTYAKLDHTAPGDTDKDLHLFTCNWQSVNAESSFQNCIITVRPAQNELCYEVVLPAWQSDPVNPPTTKFSSFRLDPNTNTLEDNSVRFDAFDRTGLVPPNQCIPLNWKGP